MNTHDRTKRALRERQKEIRCLNETIALFGETGRDPDDIYSALILGIGQAFQFPERTTVELFLEDKRYQTPGYRKQTYTCANGYAERARHGNPDRVLYRCTGSGDGRPGSAGLPSRRTNAPAQYGADDRLLPGQTRIGTTTA
jgi:hypothetical protein